MSPSLIAEQTINEDEEIRFNPKYTEDHSDDDDDEDEEEYGDEEEGDRSSNSPSPYLKELKNRNGSISQIPPSALGNNSPAKRISTGGFLDVPKNGNGKASVKKNGSISYESKSNKENLENAIVEGEEGKEEKDEEEEEQVFGMD